MIDLLVLTPGVRAQFGGLATLLSVVAYMPYIVNTLRGTTRPHRASWLIWSVLATIAFFSLLYEGATASLGFSAAQAACTSVIFLLSIVRGQGRFFTRKDATILGLASLGLALWYMTDTAIYALMLSITIGLMGCMLTVQKTYWSPDSETMCTWQMSFVAAWCAVMSVGSLDWVLLAYPTYLIVLNGAIIGAWMLGQMPKARQRQEQMGLMQTARIR